MKTFIKLSKSINGFSYSKGYKRHILNQWLKTFIRSSQLGIRWAF
jgi:hypothetical protein